MEEFERHKRRSLPARSRNDGEGVTGGSSRRLQTSRGGRKGTKKSTFDLKPNHVRRSRPPRSWPSQHAAGAASSMAGAASSLTARAGRPQIFHARIGIHSQKAFVPMKKELMKEIARNVDITTAEATFEEVRPEPRHSARHAMLLWDGSRPRFAVVSLAFAVGSFWQDRAMILKLAKNVSTGVYGKGESAINKMGRMALYNLLL